MLDQQIPQVSPPRVVDVETGVRDDRAMDVLQYGLAIFALAVVVVLAVLHRS